MCVTKTSFIASEVSPIIAVALFIIYSGLILKILSPARFPLSPLRSIWVAPLIIGIRITKRTHPTSWTIRFPHLSPIRVLSLLIRRWICHLRLLTHRIPIRKVSRWLYPPCVWVWSVFIPSWSVVWAKRGWYKTSTSIIAYKETIVIILPIGSSSPKPCLPKGKPASAIVFLFLPTSSYSSL